MTGSGDTQRERRCPSSDQISEFVAGHLSPELTEELARHLESCAGCQSRLAELDEVESGSIDRVLQAGGNLPFTEESACERAVARIEQTNVPLDGLSLSGELPGSETANVHAPLTQVGDYDLLDRLGEGAMGAVYRGRHRQLGTTVAVKVLHPRRTADPSVVQRFRREMEAVGQLDHPNIVRANRRRR